MMKLPPFPKTIWLILGCPCLRYLLLLPAPASWFPALPTVFSPLHRV